MKLSIYIHVSTIYICTSKVNLFKRWRDVFYLKLAIKPSPESQYGVRRLWYLHICLLLIEQASFKLFESICLKYEASCIVCTYGIRKLVQIAAKSSKPRARCLILFTYDK